MDLTFLLCLLSVIRQYVAGALQQVVSEKEASERMLNTPTHLHQVLQDVLPRLREGPNVHHAHRDQQISEGEGGQKGLMVGEVITKQNFDIFMG